MAGLDAWAQSFKEYGEAHGTLHTRASGYKPQVGDAVVFDWDHDSGDDHPVDHVAIVYSVGTSSFLEVGGNQSDKVGTGTYSFSDTDIVGYTEPDGASHRGSIVADLDNDAAGDLVLYRPNASTGSTWWAYSQKKGGQILSDLKYGGAADIPLTGDFNGDGYNDVATSRRPAPRASDTRQKARSIRTGPSSLSVCQAAASIIGAGASRAHSTVARCAKR